MKTESKNGGPKEGPSRPKKGPHEELERGLKGALGSLGESPKEGPKRAGKGPQRKAKRRRGRPNQIWGPQRRPWGGGPGKGPY